MLEKFLLLKLASDVGELKRMGQQNQPTQPQYQLTWKDVMLVLILTPLLLIAIPVVVFGGLWLICNPLIALGLLLTFSIFMFLLGWSLKIFAWVLMNVFGIKPKMASPYTTANNGKVFPWSSGFMERISPDPWRHY